MIYKSVAVFALCQCYLMCNGSNLKQCQQRKSQSERGKEREMIREHAHGVFITSRIRTTLFLWQTVLKSNLIIWWNNMVPCLNINAQPLESASTGAETKRVRGVVWETINDDLFIWMSLDCAAYTPCSILSRNEAYGMHLFSSLSLDHNSKLYKVHGLHMKCT